MNDALDALCAVDDADDLIDIMDEITRRLRFQYFAPIEHCDLRHGLPSVVCFQNYPTRWADTFITDRYRPYQRPTRLDAHESAASQNG